MIMIMIMITFVCPKGPGQCIGGGSEIRNICHVMEGFVTQQIIRKRKTRAERGGLPALGGQAEEH